MKARVLLAAGVILVPVLALFASADAAAAPKVVVISLDGAKPDLIAQYLRRGILDRRTGLGRLQRHGSVAEQNITATPSLTAVSHIAIATGSTAVNNDIPANTFHAVASPIGTGISGFGAPIGGYQISPLGESLAPTAEPIWVQLRRAGKKVVTATWPGSDGADIRISGTLVQPADPRRITDYTLPFGAFGGLGARGFELRATDFVDADSSLVQQIQTAGLVSHGPVKVTASAIETVFCAPSSAGTCSNTSSATLSLRYDIKVAALDSSNDGVTNFDRLVVFDAAAGITAGPFALPVTGPARIRVDGKSDDFFFEGSGNKIGTAFFVSALAPDLANVRLVRYGANFIPRNAPVISAVDDINNNVGYWAPQPDFRIPERLSPGFANFPDLELEAAYQDQVRSFTEYQTRIALRAIASNPDADLVMIYFEQPDGSGHQFTLTDPRQATNFLDAASIGKPGKPAGATGQDEAKKARYERYLKFAYQQADAAVERVVSSLGVDRRGRPLSNVLVVSDHGMAPFHTAVNITEVLRNAGVDTSVLGVRTSGPAVNIYVNLQGREANGSVAPVAFDAIVGAVATALRNAKDPNAYYNPKARPLFSHVYTRPSGCGQPGFCVDKNIGQDFGDVFAQLGEGYNFDGTQIPVVARLGDSDPSVSSVYSVPNFYGAHGYDSSVPSMSAILFASGPDIRRNGRLDTVRNIDIAPTVMRILNVRPAATVDGKAIVEMLDRDH